MIEIRQLNKTFGKQQVLDNVNLSFKKGECVALIGPNGSGKTTLIKCLLSMVKADSGQIEVNGKDIEGEHLYRRDIGYMPQLNRYPESMTVNALFALLKNLRSDARETDRDLYQAFKIEEFGKKKLGNLSGGMAQKVSAALSFYFKPQILILDEPTAGLEPKANEVLKQKINQSLNEGKLILITSHILSDLDEISTDLVYLYEGRVLFRDSVDELKKQTTESKISKIVLHLTEKMLQKDV